MKLNAPKQMTWIIALVLGVVALLGYVMPIAAIAGYTFWIMTVSFVLLAAGTSMKGL